MNADTNELKNFANLSQKEIDDLMAQGFKPLPKRLQGEAEKELAGRESCIVASDNSPLAKWAERVRRNQLKGKNNG